MARDEIVLVTGATGLLGSAVVARLLHASPTIRVVALVRERERWNALVNSLEEGRDRVSPAFGDVRCPGLGVDAAARRRLAGASTTVIHLAADTAFSQPLEQARAINVEGTRHALDFAASWPTIPRFLHVSTAFVAGCRTGRIRERVDDETTSWVNAYEQSKHEAETLVRASGLAWTIARSSTVVCDTAAGGITQRNAVHRALELLYRGLAPMLPGDAATPVDLVTTDHVAGAIVTLWSHPDTAHRVFHLCAGPGAIALGELLDSMFASWSHDPEWRRRSIARPALADLDTYRLFEQTVDDVAAPSLKRITRALSYFAPQLTYPKQFETADAEHVLGGTAPLVRELVPHLAAAIAEEARR